MTSQPGVGGYKLPRAWEEAIGGWLALLRVSGRPQTTIRTRRGQVRLVAARTNTASPADVTLELLVLLFSRQDWSNDHRRGTRAALLGFYEYCCEHGHADHNPAAGLPKVAGSPPKPKPATDDIWLELVANAEPRELLMARLACEVGMRRAEVSVAHRDDLLAGVDGPSLIVHGKGGKQRVVPITYELAAEIRRYQPRSDYLFPGQIDGHISAIYVGRLISGLMPDGWSMHKLRHRFATKVYQGTSNLRVVQESMGHASVATTQRYTAVAARELRAVADAAAEPPPVASPPIAAKQVREASGEQYEDPASTSSGDGIA